MPRTDQLDREQIATLVERGKAFIAAGDLAAARVVLRRAAESRDAVAALALGYTYDPVILRELKAVGFAPDVEIARGWYERAMEFGSEEAQRRIQILARLGS
jgi:TPR repeat protein